MAIFGIAGFSGSGKTTLIERLIPELARMGLSVATIKHAHHRFDVLPPEPPLAALGEAGAREILAASPARFALVHSLANEPEPGLAEALSRLAPVDLVLIEGFKAAFHDKLEVYRAGVGPRLLAAGDRRIVALASDCPRPADLPAKREIPVFALDDAKGISLFIARHVGLLPAAPAASGGS